MPINEPKDGDPTGPQSLQTLTDQLDEGCRVSCCGDAGQNVGSRKRLAWGMQGVPSDQPLVSSRAYPNTLATPSQE